MHEAVMSDNVFTAQQPPASTRKRQQRAESVQSFAVRAVQIVIAVGFFALWEWGARSGAISTFLFSSPSEVWALALARIKDGTLIYGAYVTGMETLAGFVVGSLLGTALGLGLWYSRFLARVMSVFVLALGSIPVLALGPLVIIWFGTGIESKIALATMSCVIVALLQAYEGAQQVDKDLTRLLTSFGATKRQIFTKVVIPSSSSWVVAAAKLNVGFSLIGAVIGEYISSQHGLGNLILIAGANYNISLVLLGVFSLMILAFALSSFVGVVERKLLGWKLAGR
ncbi:ABC transporter permease [Variovorax guangxiensis]|uniref:ABC transporter permease n=1 Tax=Variovorax guangxiensis TaxID=1775474 RepID=UPI002859B0FC|nr:ABC transporter permease [Variovorax guangxiensis]MDR6861527.1 NitT/TauT family transport system permease protein [Variovorax guangxiensis]